MHLWKPFLYFLALAATTAEEDLSENELKGHVGGSITLHCDNPLWLSILQNDYNITVIAELNGTKVEVYAGDKYEGRILWNNIGFIIKDLQESDSATYVVQWNGTHTTKFKVTVNNPSQSSLTTKDPHFGLPAQSTPHNNSMDITTPNTSFPNTTTTPSIKNENSPVTIIIAGTVIGIIFILTVAGILCFRNRVGFQGIWRFCNHVGFQGCHFSNRVESKDLEAAREDSPQNADTEIVELVTLHSVGENDGSVNESMPLNASTGGGSACSTT